MLFLKRMWLDFTYGGGGRVSLIPGPSVPNVWSLRVCSPSDASTTEGDSTVFTNTASSFRQLSWTLLGSSIVPPCQNRLPDLVNTHWIRQPGHKYREMYSFSWNVTYRDRPWYLYCIKTHELSQIMSANNEERGKSSHAGSAAAVYRLPN